MLNTGDYQLITCEEDGQRYLFPILQAEEVPYVETTEQNTLSQEGWCNISIPLELQKGHQKWEPTDEFILHMQRTIMIPGTSNYVGRFSYDPITKEFLPSLISVTHHTTIDRFGSVPFNQYVRGIYLKQKKILLIRAYFDPLDENGEFDPYGFYNRLQDRIKTMQTLEMLVQNGLPKEIKTIVHVTDNKLVKRYTRYA